MRALFQLNYALYPSSCPFVSHVCLRLCVCVLLSLSLLPSLFLSSSSSSLSFPLSFPRAAFHRVPRPLLRR